LAWKTAVVHIYGLLSKLHTIFGRLAHMGRRMSNARLS
jgi:hypothetical protein